MNTYMDNRVRSDKSQSVTLQANKESQSLCCPCTLIVKSCEYLLCRVVGRRQVNQRNEDPKEAQNVYDKYNNLDGRKCSTDKDVDEDT